MADKPAAKSGAHATTSPATVKAAPGTPPPDAPDAPPSKAQREESRAAKAAAEAEKAKEAAVKVEQAAIQKAATINQRLVRDNNPRRIIGGVRNGEPKFFWGNFVPTQELTEDELKAVETV